MPYNGVGVFTRVYQWVQDAANGIFVDATRTDTDSNDIAAGLTNCVTRDGQSAWLANLPAGGFKITGLGAGSNPTDSVNYGQVFNNPTFNGLTATGVVNFAGATSVSVPTMALGDSSANAASTAFVAATAFSAALPNQTGNAGKIVTTNGTVASWTDTINIPFTFGASATVSYGAAVTYLSRVNEAKGADIASAATINLSTATGNLIHITGNTGPITTITIPVGAERTLIFDSNPILTHSASLLLPSAANIQVAAGDRVKVRGDTAGANVVSYTRADGTALAATRYALGLPIVLTPTVAANVESLNFVTASANGYLIEIEGVRPNTGGSNLTARFANSGVVDTAANYQNAAISGSNASPTTSMPLSSNTVTGGKGFSGKMDLLNMNATTPIKTAVITGISDNTATVPSFGGITGYFGGAVSGIRFFWSGGENFAATGSIRIYPIVNI